MCRRGDEAGIDPVKPHTDKTGVAYWPFFLREDGSWQPGFGPRGRPQGDAEEAEQTTVEGCRWYSHEPLAPEDLDRVYRALLGALTLSDAHRRHLLEQRGFADEEIRSYGYRTAPETRSEEEGAILAALFSLVETYHPGLLDAIRADREITASLLDGPAPSLTSMLKGRLSEKDWHEIRDSIFRVPGLWADADGHLRLGVPAGILLPIRDFGDRIVGLQVRLDEARPNGTRYLPPCAPRKLDKGSTPGSPVGQHAHVPAGTARPSARIVVVEGVFKADRSAAAIGPVVGLPSVGSWKLLRPVADAFAATTIAVAFDADARRKTSVAGALTAATVENAKEGFTIELLDWPQECGKGLDDVIQADHVGKIRTLRGRDVWTLLSERRAQAGLPPHQGVEARRLIADLVERTAADASAPFDSKIVDAIASLDEGSREEVSLLLALAKTLKKEGAATLTKRVRAARAKAARKTSTSATTAAADEAYVYEDGHLQYLMQTEAGPLRSKLANFDARITAVEKCDDGSGEITTMFVIAGKLGETPLPTTTIKATEFAEMHWLQPAWEGRAILEPGRGVADRVRHAIQVRSGAFPTTTTFAHTGWREIGGTLVYLHASGAVGNSGVKVKLTGDKLSKFDLGGEASAVETKKAVEQSLRLLWASVAEVSYPLLGLTYLAPLASILYPRFTVALIGPSGSLKTALAIEHQRHFGQGFKSDGDLPLNMLSTVTAAEGVLFGAKDALVVIDDYFPRRSSRDAEAQDKLVSLVARSIGNGQARERSKTDLSARASRPPRSVALITAEVDPLPPSGDESASNRSLKLQVRREDVDSKWLLQIQTESRPWRAMRAYIGWLAEDYASRMRTVVEQRDSLLVRLRGIPGLQARAPEMIANLTVGFTTFCSFAVSVGAISEEQADEHRDTCLKTLAELAGQQHEVSKATAPEVVYLDVFKSLIAQGRAPLLGRERRLDADLSASAKPVGWRDDKHVYLLATAVHEVVMTAMRASGQHMAFAAKTIFARWVERGWATPSTDGAHLGVQRKLGGTKQWVIEMPAGLFDDVPRPAEPALDVSADEAAVSALNLSMLTN